jgi:hypothetical protein
MQLKDHDLPRKEMNSSRVCRVLEIQNLHTYQTLMPTRHIVTQASVINTLPS